MRTRQILAAIAASATVTGVAHAANAIEVVGGQTNVALDAALIEAATGLALSGVSDDVIAPGTLEGSVAFTINARDAESLPTTFGYDLGDFGGSFAGAIEHTGSVFFNDGSVEVGNFTIGFDAARAGTLDGAASGFFVESTTGVAAILFDVAVTGAVPGGNALAVSGDLLVSPEFAAFLGNPALAGADVGDALVEGDNGVTGVDVNDNGVVDVRDFRLFIFQFIRRSAGADFNADGVVNGDDFRAFFFTWADARYDRH
ncbi:MAG: hypothetical protein ACF8QF_14430 [Phycisphaerales bacterium]